MVFSMLKKIFLFVLCSILGLVFIVSGISKLYPIEPFEYTFVDIGIFNWQVAPFVARFLIGLEFFIGFLLLFNLYLHKFAYKSGIIVLLIFSIYLVLLILLSGNKGNCGCFGTYFQMTPLQALIKNFIMLCLFFVLLKFHIGWVITKKIRFILLLIVVTIFSLPFVLNPVQLNYSEAYLNKPDNYSILPLDSLYKSATQGVPPKTLSSNKHILVFLSLKCKYCRIAANKIRIIHERNSKIPFYFVLNGEEYDLKSFYENTRTENIPHCMLLGRNFIYLAGIELPVIYLINNSVVEHQINYLDLDQKNIEDWLKH